MYTQEILHTDVLDIVFHNRNKLYGAYALRKQYRKRLLTALATTLFAVALFLLLLNRGPSFKPSSFAGTPPDSVRLTPVTLQPDKPEPPVKPQPPQAPAKSRAFTSRIKIVPDKVSPENTLPPVTELAGAAIATVSVDGPPVEAVMPPETGPFDAGTAGTGTSEAEPEVYDFSAVEEQAQFPGGLEALQRFLGRHLRVPEELQPGEKKTAIVQFVIPADGTAANFQVIQSAGEIFDKEILRVLRKLPKWKPARQNGRRVAVLLKLPVSFVTTEE